jgi:hypothetical protein
MSRATKQCAECGIVFERNRKFSRAQWAAAKYCSKACAGLALTKLFAALRPTIREKFEQRFERGSGCWNWTGTIEGYGYGVLDHNWKRYRAHVLALEFDGRPVPKGMVACHHCDNPRCVRPDHLYVGTVKDNAIDAKERGRLRTGSHHHNSRLTEGAVAEMRSVYTGKRGDVSKLARRFGVSRQTAARAIKGATWGHVS